MRLLMASTEFPPGPGGIGTHAYQLARHLTDLGWKLLVYSPQDFVPNGEIAEFNRSLPFSIVRAKHIPGPPLEGLYRTAVLRRCFARFQPDVALATGLQAVWSTALVASSRGVPWVAVAHGGVEFGTRTLWKRVVTRAAFGRADAVIAVSRYTRQLMLDAKVEPRREVVIHNGADESLFRPVAPSAVEAFRRRLGLETARILLTVGSVTERKGQDLIVRALPDILRKEPNAHYLLAGLPCLEAEIRSIGAGLGVADHLHFLGRLEQADLVLAYNACDVYVMTSRHSRDGDSEGFGIAAVEAALCGKSSIVTSGSGLEEAVQAGETALVVPEEDPAAIAQAVIRLLSHDELRQSMGRRARARALASQTWRAIAEMYARRLEEVVASTGRSHPAR